MVPVAAESEGYESTFPWMNLSLILVNFGFFFYELSLSSGALDHFINAYSLVPCEYTGHCAAYPGTPTPLFITLFSSMFLHAGWSHILGNMLFLYVFGNNLERSMGPWRYLAFYLLCGLGADALEIATSVNSNVPGLGASGAISGVLAGFLVLYPSARITTLVGFIPLNIPAWVFIVGWFAYQLLNGVAALTNAGTGGGVAYSAHVGGFITGLILVGPFSQDSRVDRLRTYHRIGMS